MLFYEPIDWLPPNKQLSRRYKGKVIFNKDPKNIQRIKCHIDGIYEGPYEKLPWITIQREPGVGATPFGGSKSTIELDSEVIIEFLDDSVYHPVCVGYWVDQATESGLINHDYPNSYGYHDKTGTQLKVNMLTKLLDFIHASGVSIKMRETGDLLIKVPKNFTMMIEGDADLKVLGNVLSKVDGSLLSEVTKNRVNATKGGHWDDVQGMYQLTAAKGAIRKMKSVVETSFEDYAIDAPNIFRNCGKTGGNKDNFKSTIDYLPAYVANLVETEPAALWAAPKLFKPGWNKDSGNAGVSDEKSLDSQRK